MRRSPCLEARALHPPERRASHSSEAVRTGIVTIAQCMSILAFSALAGTIRFSDERDRQQAQLVDRTGIKELLDDDCVFTLVDSTESSKDYLLMRRDFSRQNDVYIVSLRVETNGVHVVTLADKTRYVFVSPRSAAESIQDIFGIRKPRTIQA